MEVKNASPEGGEEFYFNRRILCRESSAGRSSRRVYSEGVPFEWEKKPGTPKHDHNYNYNKNNNIPPLSPPPSLQSLGLPKPCFDHHTQQSSHVFSWRKIKKMLLGKKLGGSSSMVEQHKPYGESFRVGDSDGEFIASLNNSNSSSSSSSSSCCSNGDATMEQAPNGPFCCSPWDVKPLMDEEINRSGYKAFFRQEENGHGGFFSLSSILARLSSVEESSRFYYSITSQPGIPFQWEMQPGAPKTPPENDIIPPPLAQSLALSKPRIASTTGHQPETESYSPWRKVWVGIKGKKLMKSCKRLGNNKDKEMRLGVHCSNEEDSFPLTTASSSKTKML